jgi:hypothetical protein
MIPSVTSFAKTACKASKIGKRYKHSTLPEKIEFERFLNAIKRGSVRVSWVDFGGFSEGRQYA